MSYGIKIFDSNANPIFSSEFKSFRLHAFFSGTLDSNNKEYTFSFEPLNYVPPVIVSGKTFAIVAGGECPNQQGLYCDSFLANCYYLSTDSNGNFNSITIGYYTVVSGYPFPANSNTFYPINFIIQVFRYV